MSIIRHPVRCQKCGSVYSFNPDIGHMRCPKCFTMNDPIENKVNDEPVLLEILRKRKKRS